MSTAATEAEPSRARARSRALALAHLARQYPEPYRRLYEHYLTREGYPRKPARVLTPQELPAWILDMQEPRSWYPDRDAKIAELVSQGVRLADIGDMVGLTGERVRQIALREGAPTPSELRRAARAKAKAAAEALALQRATRSCVVCRRAYVTTSNRITCGNPDCAYILSTGGRRLLDEKHYESHRRAVARRALRNANSKPSMVAFAQKVIDGTAPPPNRRYMSAHSKLRAALVRVGREDLIPASRIAQQPCEYRCRVTNLDGTPCSRGVYAEGDVCHIHRGLATSKPA